VEVHYHSSPMAPPTIRPRLSTLEPEFVSREFAETLRNNLEALAKRVGAEFTPPNIAAYEKAAHSKMEKLIRYAQTGEGSNPNTLLKDLSDCFKEDLGPNKHPNLEAIQLVFLAAEARNQIAKKLYVSARALGALADLSEAQIRNILGRKIKFEREGIPARHARALLEERKVPGFRPQKKAA